MMKNKFLGILLSAVVAFGLWMYVITVVSPESEKTYYEIPVVLQNKEILAERGLMIVSDAPKVTLALKSDRTILNDLNEANINVITNVANIEKPGTHNLTYTISYPGNVPQGSVSVQSSSTDLITIEVENRIRKTVPIVVRAKKNADGTDTAVPPAYITDLKKVQLTTLKGKDIVEVSSVEISGPESVINQIHQAVIEVDLNRTDSILGAEYIYTLCNEANTPVDAKMVTANVDKVNLSLKIQRVKEIALNLEILYGGGANADNCEVLVDTQTIQVAGDDDDLAKLYALSVGKVDLSTILEDTVLEFPIVLADGVENLTGVDKVRVEVKFTGLKMKTLNVTNIIAVNIPDGLKVDVITKVLQVTVRGSEAELKRLTEADLTVEADFSGAQPGVSKVEPKILVSSAFSGVGAVYTDTPYEVSANVSEAAPAAS